MIIIIIKKKVRKPRIEKTFYCLCLEMPLVGFGDFHRYRGDFGPFFNHCLKYLGQKLFVLQFLETFSSKSDDLHRFLVKFP